MGSCAASKKRSGVSVALTLALLAGSARAEEPVVGSGKRVLLLGTSLADQRAASAIEAPLGAVLREQGMDVLALDEARALFEARHSSEPEQLDDADIDIVAKQAQQALLHVATGRNARARRAITKVLERAERAMESLNRTNDSARHVLNACLYLVRAMLDAGNRDSALTKVGECRRLVPDIAPDPEAHPPKVIAIYREAGDVMSTRPTGSLTIHSEPSGCDAYINGRRLGVTPYVVKELPAGEYRVQAECGQLRGRVHRVLLAAQPTTVTVDARLDDALSTAAALKLNYEATDAADARRFEDTLEVARIVDAPYALSYAPQDAELRMDLVDVDARRVIASVFVPKALEGRSRDKRLREASERLLRGESARQVEKRWEPAETWIPPVPVEETQAEAPTTRPTGRTLPRLRYLPPERLEASWREPLVLSILTATGLIASGIATWLHVEQQQRADDFRGTEPTADDFLLRQRDLDKAQFGPLIAAGLASAALTASVPFWVKRGARRGRKDVRWWHWTLGAAGLAAAGAGAYWLAAQPECLDARCTRREPRRTVGATLLLHAIPLTAIPLTKWWAARRATEASTQVEAQLSAGGLRLSGRF